MSILKIARMGHPVLRQPARPLESEEIAAEGLASLIHDMLETLQDASGLGLAAPQVHVGLQLVVVNIPPGNENPEFAGMENGVLVNPVVTPIGEEKFRLWEGCLSIPDLMGEVQRHAAVRVDYLDRTGRLCTVEAKGLAAAVFQHEIDHLDGRLFVDRMDDTRKFSFVKEYARHHM